MFSDDVQNAFADYETEVWKTWYSFFFLLYLNFYDIS
jgi:hypothetical protein